MNKKSKPLGGWGGGEVHQLNNNNQLFNLQLFTDTLSYSKVSNPYEHILTKHTYVKGIITANTEDITIETGSTSKIYDGTPLSDNNLSLVSGELNSGDKLVCDTTKQVSSITNAGSTSNVLTPKIINSTTGEDHTDNYNITINYGTLMVNKRQVTLTSSNYVIFGVLSGKNTVSIGDMGFVNNEVISTKTPVASEFRKGKNIGKYENKPITINWADGANPNNYDITYKYGTVTIII